MILYLGLDPENFAHQDPLLHYPVIRTQKLPLPPHVLSCWPHITHAIFTSRTAVRYWWEEKLPFGSRIAIAIGPGTAGELASRGIAPLIAPDAVQEGVIDLLSTQDLFRAHLLLPQSTLSRPLLRAYLTEQRIPHCAFPLYKTVLQKLEPVPSLDDVEEIVFTSPSTVEGFLKIYGKLPQGKKVTAIGPITKKALTSVSSLRS